MRKYHQKLILDAVNSLIETTDDAEKLSSTNLLADCQKSAIEIGHLVEQLEGEGHILVQHLEEYCELLYRASLELTNQVNSSSIFEDLQRLLSRIEKSTKNDIKPRIEVVFLSYKASMWDSLESIWLSASKCSYCDAHVIPIPFFEKNTDGSFGTFFDESNNYPDYVPVVDWKNYNIAERHPDIIFINNPYDNANFVTSVHPDYYAERLRNFTDMLVYVPYFVTDDKLEEHFAVLPGTIYSHKTIVQSDKIRTEYLRHYKAFEKSNDCIDMFGTAEDKFLALGSPKFDAVMNKKRTDFHVPDEWERLIKNPDGTNKKVILYNTAVAGLLNGDEKVLHKLRHVFACFKENNELVLLWRPHPLSVATCKSMRPQLLNEYQQLIDDYRHDGYGIYDDSPDLHRAIAISDVYYGDGSSLVPMYGITGKPIVIQNIRCQTRDKALFISDFSIDKDGKIWGFDAFSDGLFRLNFNMNSAKFITRSNSTPRENGVEMPFITRYRKVHCTKEQVICFPYYSDNIFIYNLLTKEQAKIAIDKKYLLPIDVYNSSRLRFTIQHLNKIYCFGVGVKAIVVFNANSFEVEYHTLLFEKIGFWTDNNRHYKYPLYISKCDDDGQIILIMKNFGHIIRYSLMTQEIEYLFSITLLEKCMLATISDNHVWLVANKYEKLIKINIEANTITEYSIPLADISFSDEEHLFNHIYDFGRDIFLFPYTSDKILKFDKEFGVFVEYLLDVSELSEDRVDKMMEVKDCDSVLYIFYPYNRTVYELEKLSGKVTPHKFMMDAQEHKQYYSYYFGNNNEIVCENEICCIIDFFAASFNGINAKRKRNFLDYSANKDGSAGKKIFDRISRKVLY